jgi:hypothetical protein
MRDTRIPLHSTGPAYHANTVVYNSADDGISSLLPARLASVDLPCPKGAEGVIRHGAGITSVGGADKDLGVRISPEQVPPPGPAVIDDPRNRRAVRST